MGRMREVCGAVSGMYIVLGHLYGYDTVGDDRDKKRLYHEVQQLAEEFRPGNGRRLTDDQVAAKLADIAALYAVTAEDIRQYENG